MEKLEVKNVSKSFDGRPVLSDISIELNRGELVCLLGVSGGGKTTLFNIISGLLMPDTGTVLLDGRDITGKPGSISYMLQKDLLLPYRTIEDNAALPLLLKGMKKREARAQAAPLFAQFGLEGTEKKYPAQLSGGMRQRAALLRTYLFSRDVALLDEPFFALDTLTKSALHRWFLDVMEKIRLSTLFITHDIDEAICCPTASISSPAPPAPSSQRSSSASPNQDLRILTSRRNFSTINGRSSSYCDQNADPPRLSIVSLGGFSIPLYIPPVWPIQKLGMIPSKGVKFMTQAILEQCRKADVQTCDPEALVDLREIRIDVTRPRSERMEAFLRQIRNPYLFKVEGLVVKAVYEPQASRPLADALPNC